MFKKLIFGLSLWLFATTLIFGANFQDGVNAVNKGDYKAALAIFEDLSSKGDAEAQNKIGDMYFYEQGVGQDYKKAALWYEKAANQGHKIAQYNTAYLYKKSYKSEKAIKWYEKAANKNTAQIPFKQSLGQSFSRGLQAGQQKALGQWEKLASTAAEITGSGDKLKLSFQKLIHR